MVRSRRAKRNIKMNLTRFGEKRYDPTDAIGSVSYKVSAALIAILLPVIALIFSANAVFRMPDLYSFEFDRSGIAQELGIDVSAKKMSSVISDYMLHKTDEFVLVAEYKGKDVSILSIRDAAKMQKIRNLMDVTVAILCVSILLSVMLFVIVLRFSKKRYLKYACRSSVGIYVLLVLVSSYIAAADDIRHMLTDKLIGTITSPDDVYPQLFTNYFRFEAAAAVFVISCLILSVLLSIGRKFYKETKMFG